MVKNFAKDKEVSINKERKVNNRKVLIILALAVAAIAIGVYFLTKNSDGNNNGSQASQPAGSSLKASSSTFAPITTTKLAFTATLDTTLGGKITTVTLKSDGKGNSFYSTGEGASHVEITYTKDAYYLCSGTNPCLKYPISQLASSGFDPGNYQYAANTINDLKSKATYKGKKSCPAGDCFVWETTQGSTKLKVYIDIETSRISQVEGTTGKQTTKYVYDYKTAVNITPPADAKSAPKQ